MTYLERGARYFCCSHDINLERGEGERLLPKMNRLRERGVWDMADMGLSLSVFCLGSVCVL